MTRRRRWLFATVGILALVATACGSGESTETVSVGVSGEGSGDTDNAANADGLAQLAAAVEALAALDSYTADIQFVLDPPIECQVSALDATFAVSAKDTTATADLRDTEASPDAIRRGATMWIRRDLLWSDQISDAEWVDLSEADSPVVEAVDLRTGFLIEETLADEGDVFDTRTVGSDILRMANSVAATAADEVNGVSTTRYDLVVSVSKMYFGDGASVTPEQGEAIGSAISEEPAPPTSDPTTTATRPAAATPPAPADLSPEARALYDAYRAELGQIADFGGLVESGLRYDDPERWPDLEDGERLMTLAAMAFEERFVAMWEDQFGVPSLTMWVDGDGVLVKASLQMELPDFYASLDEGVDPNDSTSYQMAIEYGGFNEPVDATPPDPSQVVAAADLPDPDLVEPCDNGTEIFEETGEPVEPPPIDVPPPSSTLPISTSTSIITVTSTTSNPSTSFATTSTYTTTTVTAPPTTVP